MGILEGLHQAVDYLKGDKTKARVESVTVLDSTKVTSDHRVRVLHRDWENVPVEKREELLTALDNSLDTYLRAIGYKDNSQKICSYSDWYIQQQNEKLMYYSGDGDEDLELVEVREVFRIKAGEYDDKDTGDLEKIATDANISFDICGELDDCSAFVFWALVN